MIDKLHQRTFAQCHEIVQRDYTENDETQFLSDIDQIEHESLSEFEITLGFIKYALFDAEFNIETLEILKSKQETVPYDNSVFQSVIEKILDKPQLHLLKDPVKKLILNVQFYCPQKSAAIAADLDALLEALLTSPDSKVHEKAILTFQTQYNRHTFGTLSDKIAKAMKYAMKAVIIAAIITSIVLALTVTIGIIAGAWTGPIAFLMALTAGHASAIAAASVTGASGVGILGLASIGLFSNHGIDKFEAQAIDEFTEKAEAMLTPPCPDLD